MRNYLRVYVLLFFTIWCAGAGCIIAAIAMDDVVRRTRALAIFICVAGLGILAGAVFTLITHAAIAEKPWGSSNLNVTYLTRDKNPRRYWAAAAAVLLVSTAVAALGVCAFIYAPTLGPYIFKH